MQVATSMKCFIWSNPLTTPDNVHFSVCEAIDGETRSLVLRSGVHELFISIIKDPMVSGMYKASN